MSSGRWFGFGIAVLCAGCGVPLEDAALLVRNTCERASDCAAGSTCSTVGAKNRCVATKADLSGLVLEVEPGTPPNFDPNKQASLSGGVSYLLDPAADGVTLSGTQTGGFKASYDPKLPKLAEITEGRIVLNPSTLAENFYVPCPQEGATLYADVIFRRASPFAGIPAVQYTATSVFGTDAAPNAYVFSISLPPDTYDIYVKPRTPDGCTKTHLKPDMTTEEIPVPAPPPYFIARQKIAGGTMLNITLPPLQRLTGTVEVPSALNIIGWELALLEPASGLEISTVQSMVQDLAGVPTKIEANEQNGIDYSWSPETGGRPIVRLRPPESAPGTAATAVHWPLVTADVNGDNDVTLVLGALNTPPVHIDARVLDGSGDPVAASVSIQAIGKDTTDAKNVSLEVLTDADEDGQFYADVFPASSMEAGSYSVSARPKHADSTAIGQDTWTIKSQDQCFCGHAVELHDKTLVHASVTAPTGEAMRQATANADPSLPMGGAYFQSTLFEPTLEPRNASATVDAGQLSIPLDPGTYDISIRPDPASGYPWLVSPRRRVDQDTDALPLDPLEVPFPVVLQGVLLDADGKPMPNAVMRAWLPILDNPDSQEKTKAIQIAETVSDAEGNYILTLPPSVFQ